MPFGLKLAGYAAALARSRERLQRLRKEALVLQFGGAAGTLAALGEHGLAVTERLAALLDLPAPDAPWHSHSDRLVEIAAALAILTGTCGKIARDVALLMQTEVAEAHEPPRAPATAAVGLPHKRIPNLAAIGIAAATMAPNLLATIVAGQVQEHERGLGGWQAQAACRPRAAAGHLRRARGGRGVGAGAGDRRRTHAQQSRYHAGPDHGRRGVDDAGGEGRAHAGED